MEDDLGMELFDINLEDLGIESEEEIIDDQSGDNISENDDKIKDNLPDEDVDPEEVVEDKNKDTEDEDPDADDAGTDSPDLFKSLVNVLADEGVLTEVDSEKEIKSIDDVINLVKGEISKQEFSDLNELQKEAVEAYRAGIPVERFNKQKEVENRLDSIDEVAIEGDANLRKQLIYQEFKSSGFSDEKAAKLTKRSFDAEEDIEDAKAALSTLKNDLKEKFTQEKLELETNRKNKIESEKKKQEAIKNKIFETNEIIKGYKVNEGLKKKIYSEIYNPSNINPDNGRKENNLMKYQRENPEDFMHKLYYMWTATKGFENFEYFQNKERSNGVKDLENALRQSSHVRSGGNPTFADDPESFSFDLGDELVID